MDLPKSVRSHGHSCRPAGDFIVHLRGADSRAIDRVHFRVGPNDAGHDDDNPLKKELRPRLLRAKHHAQIRAIAELRDGRLYSRQKEIRVCR
jgi:hypothetical protein